MRVSHPIHDPATGKLVETITGELSVRTGVAIFSPDDAPWGPRRLVMQRPEVSIYGADDDDCISVSGLVDAGQDRNGAPLLRHLIMETFYPLPRS